MIPDSVIQQNIRDFERLQMQVAQICEIFSKRLDLVNERIETVIKSIELLTKDDVDVISPAD